MATVQTSVDSPTVGLVAKKDTNGLEYTPIGNIRFYTGTGVPAHNPGKVGSLCVDTDSGKLYINTGSATWAVVGTQT